jgi:hypothetical protein
LGIPRYFQNIFFTSEDVKEGGVGGELLKKSIGGMVSAAVRNAKKTTSS